MRKPTICISILLLLTAQSQAQPAAQSQAQPAASVLTTSPFVAATVNDFLVACRGDRSACTDEVGSAMMDKFQFQGDICLPSPDYADAVPGWLSAHAETYTLPTEDGIYLALKSLYRCD